MCAAKAGVAAGIAITQTGMIAVVEAEELTDIKQRRRR